MYTTRNTHLLIGVHGIYLLLDGLWRLVALPGLKVVTGTQEEHWLIRSVACLLLVIALALLAQRRKLVIDSSAIAVAMGTSLVLGSVGMITASEGVVNPVYFGIGAIHLFFVALWCGAVANNVWRGGHHWLDLPQGG